MYILAAIVALILGAFSGWYFFINTQSKTITTGDAARGYGETAPLGATSGIGGNTQNPASQTKPAPAESGFFSSLLRTITGGTGISEPPSSASRDQNLTGFADTDAVQQTGAVPPKSAPRPPKLWNIHNKPVAGLAFTKSAGSERVRYVERGSGYVFEANPKQELSRGSLIRSRPKSMRHCLHKTDT